MKLTSDSLASHLERQLLPAYLVSGDEALLTGEAADAIRARARAGGFTEREVHFIERVADWNDVSASASNLSLFAARRLVEIRLPSGKPGVAGGAVITRMVAARDPDTVLLILTPKLERDAQSAEWVKAIDTHGAWVQVWPVEAGKLVSWLRTRCRRMGLEASDEALELLAERTEGNLLAAHQELEKLRLLAPGGRVTPEVVIGSVADSARFDVFQLNEAVLAGDAARALRVLSGLRSEGVEPTLALWALIKAQRDLWNAHASGNSVQRSWARQAAALEKGLRRVSRLHFGRLTTRAARADRMIKGRLSGDAWDEIALLALDFCACPALPAPRTMFK